MMCGEITTGCRLMLSIITLILSHVMPMVGSVRTLIIEMTLGYVVVIAT